MAMSRGWYWDPPCSISSSMTWMMAVHPETLNYGEWLRINSWTSIHKDLGKFEDWTNMMKLSAKGYTWDRITQCLGTDWMSSSPDKRDLEITVNARLNMSQLCAPVTSRAGWILGYTTPPVDLGKILLCSTRYWWICI